MCLKGHSRAGHRAQSGYWGNEENDCDSCGDQATPTLAGQTKADSRQKRESGRRRSVVPAPSLSSVLSFPPASGGVEGVRSPNTCLLKVGLVWRLGSNIPEESVGGSRFGSRGCTKGHSMGAGAESRGGLWHGVGVGAWCLPLPSLFLPYLYPVLSSVGAQPG